ncbi:hypothetical protein KIN20_036630 [Parelaphostrongylus tenuis]|uniref:Uncharacterized protein n=1 Tax=Parelaphostrongylus tenuis TaxID=148309 RepID=A0AAD5RCZ1_PARTN|nr:hypothetical protein KIN20_036630 [Parelaphostrongylus tenuis]
MRSTRGSNPTLVGRVASVRQRHSGVDDKSAKNGRRPKAATVCEQMRSTRGSNPTSRRTCGVHPTTAQRSRRGGKTEGVESGNGM